MNSVAYCGWQTQTGRTPGAADAPPGVLFVIKTPFFIKKIQTYSSSANVMFMRSVVISVGRMDPKKSVIGTLFGSRL